MDRRLLSSGIWTGNGAPLGCHAGSIARPVSGKPSNDSLAYPSDQRRQFGLKSGRSWIPGSKKFRFLQANFLKISIYFQAILQKISIFHSKISHFQLLLGKLFYFSSKVTT